MAARSMDKLVCLTDFEAVFTENLPSNTVAYFTDGADAQTTHRWNMEAYQRIQMMPRMLVQDVSQRDLSSTILGKRISFPVGIAPTGGQGCLWPGGEVDMYKGAAAADTCFVHSTFSTRKLEEVVAAATGGLKWFQLYIIKDRAVSEKIVKQIEGLGYDALVVTVDAMMLGNRWRTKRNPLVLPPGMTFHLFETAKQSAADRGVPMSGAMDASLTWKDIDWLRSLTRLPLVVKGILTVEDAVLAVEHGAAGIVVSNHGGRQVDTSPATIEVLPEIVKAVAGRAEVYVDGGIRLGTDVFKALALGARAVFIGRPACWGLTVAGADGVKKVLDILREELSMTMALSGCRKISDINRSFVRLPGDFSML